MPRYYRRRYTRVVKPKKKWASNILTLSPSGTINPDYRVLYTFDLVKNSMQTYSPTPVIVKCGNFKVQMDTSYVVSMGAAVDVKAFILFMPEGVTVSNYLQAEGLITSHPEWIMGWKYASIDYTAQNTQSGTQTINFSTRLKRNLNSGDKVCLFVMANSNNANANITGMQIGGMAQFWTCAN